jgi:hypothetical protein
MTAALLFVPLALAIGVPPPTIAPARTTTQPLVDGSLDDAVWATAPVFDFGRQRALGVGATLRSTWTFTPELSLQAYAQVFAASVRYQDFQAAPATDLVVTLDQLVPAGAPAKSPDSVEGTLNTSVVLRWEWRLGSTLYVVYSHAQANAGALVPGDGAAGLPVRSTLHAPAADTLLVKLSMWIG